MFLLLQSCACPTFDEMEVTSSGGDPAAVETVSQALSDFAAWTQEEGVCVPEIAIVDSVDPLHGFVLAGLYSGPHAPIQIDARRAGSSLREVTVHELCHATDYLNGHSERVAFPDIAPSGYPDDARPGENFALACEDGPTQLTLTLELDRQCGRPADESVLYLHDVVFPGGPRLRLDDAPATFRVTPGALRDVLPDARVFDAQVDDEGVLILGGLQQADGGYRMRVTRYDPGTGRPTSEYRILAADTAVSGSFIASDSDATVVLHFLSSGVIRNVVYTLGDGGFEPILEFSTTGSWGLGARTGGLLAFYASFTASPDAPTLRVWREDGLEQPVPSLPGSPDALWPREGLLGVHSDDTIHYLDLRTGEETATEAPEGTIYAGALDGATDLFWAREQDILVLHDALADVWYLQGSPCVPLGGIGLGVGAQLAPHDGAVYWIGRTPQAKGDEFQLAYERMSFHIPE